MLAMCVSIEVLFEHRGVRRGSAGGRCHRQGRSLGRSSGSRRPNPPGRGRPEPRRGSERTRGRRLAGRRPLSLPPREPLPLASARAATEVPNGRYVLVTPHGNEQSGREHRLLNCGRPPVAFPVAVLFNGEQLSGSARPAAPCFNSGQKGVVTDGVTVHTLWWSGAITGVTWWGSSAACAFWRARSGPAADGEPSGRALGNCFEFPPVAREPGGGRIRRMAFTGAK